MRSDRTFRILQSIACVVCAILVWRYTGRLEGTEFSGGQITARLLEAANISIILFLVALVFSFFRVRPSAATTLVASLFALPVYLYPMCPGPFRYIFKGNYSVPDPRSFVFDAASFIGISAMALALLISFSNLFVRQSSSQIVSRHLN